MRAKSIKDCVFINQVPSCPGLLNLSQPFEGLKVCQIFVKWSPAENLVISQESMSFFICITADWDALLPIRSGCVIPQAIQVLTKRISSFDCMTCLMFDVIFNNVTKTAPYKSEKRTFSKLYSIS